ncbi:unnamed protein product, partial [Angiostrongylus costaricensis]|uniref:COIL protein n=1 Tax=Angiostrongylus costaricensis TaxID=334426 RepID=A0A0R3PHJ2_ANGCS
AGGGPVGGAVGGTPGAGVAIKPPTPGRGVGGFGGGGGFGEGVPPKPVPKMAGTHDPNYQTLAGMNNEDVFKPKEFGATKPPAVAPPNPGGPKVVGTFDPNYQTLAGLNNEDVFKPKACNYKSLRKISALKLKLISGLQAACAPAGDGVRKWETY